MDRVDWKFDQPPNRMEVGKPAKIYYYDRLFTGWIIKETPSKVRVFFRNRKGKDKTVWREKRDIKSFQVHVRGPPFPFPE